MEMLDAAVPELQGIVRDIMTDVVHTAHQDASVADVATLMTRHKVRRVIVTDDERRVVGVVSQRDVLRHCLVGERDVRPPDAAELVDTTVGTLVHDRHPITVLDDVPLVRAAAVLATNKVGCLPVVDAEGQLVGILTVTDLLRHLTGEGTAALDGDFKFYAPAADARSKIPAYIRRINGDIVLPLKCLESPERLSRLVQLGYDESRGRILIKAVTDEESRDGAQKVLRDKENVIIQAGDFVAHFGLGGKNNTFNVESVHNGRYLVLSPRATN